MLSLKELFSAKDMTQGRPWKRIMEFAVPMLIGNFAQQLYNTADSIIVGKFVGDNALAAVGSAMPILNLLLALFVGISTGAGIVVSQSFGARDRDGLNKAIGNCITLSFLASLLFLSPILFGFFTDTPELIDLATRMIRLMAVGYICVSVTQVLGGVMRGAGDTMTPMWVSFISTILLRIPAAYLIAYMTQSAEFPHGQPAALFGSLMFSWVMGMVISVVVFATGKWKKKMYEHAVAETE